MVISFCAGALVALFTVERYLAYQRWLQSKALEVQLCRVRDEGRHHG
jgi:hypothetical protein